jgi:dipeptidyl aminopeptidase/acylaminoacyl peptidase
MQAPAPYGSWKSPITSDLIVAQSIGLSQPMLDGPDVYWIESRPNEGGRNVIVRWRDGQYEELNPAPGNARTRVHEYGGGAYLVSRGQAFYSNFRDQHLYRAPAEPISATPGMRHADAVADWSRARLIAVREDHTVPAGQQPINSIVALPLDKAPGDGAALQERVLVSGNDFYAAPRLSPDGRRLAWLTWNHPNMPWDGCELWVADVDTAGALGNATLVAGGLRETVFQPEWSPDGELHFVAEETGWWNLYRWRDGRREPLTPMDAEFGEPMWAFRMRTYGFLRPDLILCSYSRRGTCHLALLDTSTCQLCEIDTPYTTIGGVTTDVTTIGGRAVMIAGSPTQFSAVVLATLDQSGNAPILRFETLRSSNDLDLTALKGYVSMPQAIEFPTTDGKTAHAFYYPPANKDYIAPPGELPPVLVKSHGGPTSSTSASLKLAIQYWTSRGIGVLDVNYGGSTGYGRDYRRRLNGNWGIVDMDDCVNAPKYLAARGVIDGTRLMISGGSAGGYTTLCALTFRDVFKAGASYYGVSDAEALARDTHKFESRYLDSLIGPYPARRDIYIARSPIHFAERINAPLLFLQGLEDEVVPPNQSERMYQAVRAKGIPTAYLTFAGEQHGFRKAGNIKRALEAEFYFYSRVFGYTPADALEPVDIDNCA